MKLIVKVIETQQQAYMLDNNTKEIPDVQTLRSKKIILQKIKRKHMKIVKTPEQ